MLGVEPPDSNYIARCYRPFVDLVVTSGYIILPNLPWSVEVIDETSVLLEEHEIGELLTYSTIAVNSFSTAQENCG